MKKIPLGAAALAMLMSAHGIPCEGETSPLRHEDHIEQEREHDPMQRGRKTEAVAHVSTAAAQVSTTSRWNFPRSKARSI